MSSQVRFSRRSSRARLALVSVVASATVLSGHSLLTPGAEAARTGGRVIRYEAPRDSLRSWGSTYLPSTVLSDVVAVTGGTALRRDGSVITWGVDRGLFYTRQLSDYGVTSIAQGGYVVMMLDKDRNVRVVGGYDSEPFPPPEVQGRTVDIEYGLGRCFALLADGTVWTWGGALDTSFPGFLPRAGSGITAISASETQLLGLRGGEVLNLGSNPYHPSAPVPAEARSGVVDVRAGSGHAVALLANGSVVAWGDNEYGQATVPPAARSGVKAIAAGWYHSVALKTDGTVVAWGRDDNGQATVPANIQGKAGIIGASGSISYATVSHEADLGVTFDEVKTGRGTFWIVKVTNKGPAAVTGVVTRLLLPDGVSLEQESNGDEPRQSGKTLFWSTPRIDNGQSISLSAHVFEDRPTESEHPTSYPVGIFSRSIRVRDPHLSDNTLRATATFPAPDAP